MGEIAAARPPELERAIALQNELEFATLTITDLKTQFLRKDFTNLTDSALSSYPTNPRIVVPDVLAQQSFLRKLKFHYIEQHAKDKYIKFIVSPNEPEVEAEHNEKLKEENVERKRLLQEDKASLAKTYDHIKHKAILVDQAYHRAQEATNEAVTLTQKILDARLALTRLRAAHPPPRLTLSAAKQIADEQEEQMITLDSTLLDLNSRIDEAKDRVKATVKEVDKLKLERAAKEEELKRTQRQHEDRQWLALHDWYKANLSLHKSLMALEKFNIPSVNELRLTYLLPKGRKSTIVFVFLPATRRISEAYLTDSDIDLDIQRLVKTYSTPNDVPSLLRTILVMLRAAV